MSDTVVGKVNFTLLMLPHCLKPLSSHTCTAMFAINLKKCDACLLIQVVATNARHSKTE